MTRKSRREAPDDLREFCATAYPVVFGSLRLYTGDPHLAEDLTQETFVRVCRDWTKLGRITNPLGWAHTVAFNLAKSKFRRRGAQRRAETKTQHNVTAAAASRASMPDAAEVMSVRDAVASLDDDRRAVIVLRYFGGLSVYETANALGIPEGTVKTRTRRAIDDLRGHGLTIENTEEDEDPSPAPMAALHVEELCAK